METEEEKIQRLVNEGIETAKQEDKIHEKIASSTPPKTHSMSIITRAAGTILLIAVLMLLFEVGGTYGYPVSDSIDSEAYSTRPNTLENTSPVNPGIPSGSLCRGACGEDCPKTCKVFFEETVCADGVTICKYLVKECGSNEGCRVHDDCYDACATAFSPFLCKRVCDAKCPFTNGILGPFYCVSWALGYGPYDSWLKFSELIPEDAITKANNLIGICDLEFSKTGGFDMNYTTNTENALKACRDALNYVNTNKVPIGYMEATLMISSLDTKRAFLETKTNVHGVISGSASKYSTPTGTPSNYGTAKPTGTPYSGEDILSKWNKCYNAFEDAKKDSKRAGQPSTYKINYAIDVCEDALQYYEALPLGSYTLSNGDVYDFNKQAKRISTVSTEETIKFLNGILIPNTDRPGSPGYLFYDNRWVDPVPVPYTP